MSKKHKTMETKNMSSFSQKVWEISPTITISEISEIVTLAIKLNELNELMAGTTHNNADLLVYEKSNGDYYMSIRDHFTGLSCEVEIKDPISPIKNKLNELSQKYNIYFYHQTDPKGMPLYVSDKPIDASNYLDAIAVPV